MPSIRELKPVSRTRFAAPRSDFEVERGAAVAAECTILCHRSRNEFQTNGYDAQGNAQILAERLSAIFGKQSASKEERTRL